MNKITIKHEPDPYESMTIICVNNEPVIDISGGNMSCPRGIVRVKENIPYLRKIIQSTCDYRGIKVDLTSDDYRKWHSI